MKVLLIGLGSIAKKHITALHTAGVTDIYALRSSANSVSYEGVKDLHSYDDIKKVNFEFFIISNITSRHSETIKKLITFQKPLFIEKPLFGEVNTENSALVAEIVKRKIPTYIACNLRFLDSLVELKEMIKNSRINEVNAYSGSYLPNWRPNVDFRKNYSANKEMGGGVHIDLIHELDYLYWMFGDPAEVRSAFTNKSSLDISAVDYANYLWHYRDFNANVILNYYRRDTKRSLEVVTSDSTFYVDLIKNTIYKNNEKVFSSGQRIQDTFYVQMKFFLNKVLKNNQRGFNSIDEAYKILQLCLRD